MRDDKNRLQLVEIYENKDNYNKWREFIFEQIDFFPPDKIRMLLIQNPWYLTWLKFVKPYLSLKDFSKFLGEIWVEQENPNGDVNVSIKEAIRWFKMADKRYLMCPEDYDIYINLPDEIEVYRGVSRGREKDGLSYTRNKEKAEWFQGRFATDENKGFLIKATISKDDVLAYFNTRGEEELVINSLNIKKEYL